MTGNEAQPTAQALWYVEPGRVEIRSEALAAPAADTVLVRMLHSGVSRGTEALVLAGRVPDAEYSRMRGPNMGGAFPFPVKYGYAAVGVIEAGPAQLSGRPVFALHPHQTAFVVPTESVTPLPSGLPPARAVLAANMETALNAVWDAAPAPADRIAVVGGGVVGCLVAWLCGRLPGADVTLVDIDPAREASAQPLGVAYAGPYSAPEDCDIVFHTSASAAGLATALRIAGTEATVAELSWYGAGEIAVPLGGAFHSRRLRLISTQVGQIAPSHRARWDYRRRMNAALRLLAGAPCLDTLIAPPIAFADAPGVLPKVLSPGSGVLCQRIDYPTFPHQP